MALPGLNQHPKFRRLVHILGEPRPHVRGYLELLWETGYQSGNPLVGDAVDVELAAEFPGEPGKLTKALLECRFLDQRPDNLFEIHDLVANAPEYVKRRARREAERRSASVSDQPMSVSDRPSPVSGVKKAQLTGTGTGTEQNTLSPPATVPPKKPRKTSKPRERNPVFDAIAEITGSDPEVSGAHIGKVAALLAKAKPPYTPEEVRRLPEAIKSAGLPQFTLTVGAIEKYIGLVRTPPKGACAPKSEADLIEFMRLENERIYDKGNQLPQ